MSDFAVDTGGRPTGLRYRGVVGAMVTGTATDSGWYRVLPDGVTASVPLGQTDQLTLTNLRLDVLGVDFRGWLLVIANAGLEQVREVVLTEAGTVTVDAAFDPVLPATGVRYILSPRLLNAFHIVSDPESLSVLEVAYTPEFLMPGGVGYSREEIAGETVSPSLVRLANLPAGSGIRLPFADVRNLFYRWRSASVSNRFAWGEQWVARSGGGGGGSGGAALSYSPDDPTMADDSTPFVLQTTDGRLFYRDADGNYVAIDVPEGGIIDARQGLPAPTADDDDRLAVSNDGVYYVEIFQTAATPADATFTTFTVTGYRGAESTLPQRPMPGESFYHTTQHQWYHVATSNGANYWVSGGNPSGWIPGNYTSRVDARQGINQLIAPGVTTGVVWTGTVVERFSAFVAAMSPETQRRWDRLTTGSGGGTGLTEAQVKAEIRPFAQTDSTPTAAREDLVSLMDGAASDDERIDIGDTKGEIPDGRIPAGVARDSEIGDLVFVLLDASFPAFLARDNEIATEARSGNTDRWGKPKLPTDGLYEDSDLDDFPSGLARDSEIGDLVFALLDASFPAFLARDNEIATEARSGNTGRWGKPKLPTDGLYQDTDVANFPSGLARASDLASYALSSAVPTNAEIETLVGNMVDGGTETGITVTFNPTTRKLNFVVTGSTTPPPVSTHQRYGTYGFDSTFVAADFTSGIGAATNTLTLSGATDRQYVAFWSAQQLTRIDATGRAAFGNTNQIDRFTETRLMISTTNGYRYISNTDLPSGYINGVWTLE